MMAKFIVGSHVDRIYEALLAAGIVTEPADDVSRVVIDLKAGNPGRIYIEKFADDSLADVLLSAGIADLDSETSSE